jgi:hypothetical protein
MDFWDGDLSTVLILEFGLIEAAILLNSHHSPLHHRFHLKKFFMCIYFILLTQMYYFLEKIMAKENLF